MSDMSITVIYHAMSLTVLYVNGQKIGVSLLKQLNLKLQFVCYFLTKRSYYTPTIF